MDRMEDAAGADGAAPSCNTVTPPEEVARIVGNVLGKDKFSQFIVEQGLDGEAFAELQEKHLQTFKSPAGELPTLGELIKLERAVDQIKAMQSRSYADTSEVADQHQQDASNSRRSGDRRKGTGGQGAQSQREIPFQGEEPKTSATRSIFGKRRRSQSTTEVVEAEDDDDELTDTQIFKKPKKSRYLVDRYGAQFVLNLQQSGDILKRNVDDARSRMSTDRLRNLNCGQNPKDKELLDGIEKKTRLEFDERFGGKLVTRDGREVQWPSGEPLQSFCKL